MSFVALAASCGMPTETAIAPTNAPTITVPAAPTESTSTPTTKPPPSFEAVAYLETVQDLTERASEATANALAANAAWDEREIAYSDTHAILLAAADSIAQVADETEELDRPDEFSAQHSTLVRALSDLRDSTKSMLAGLESADDGSARQNASAALLNSARLATLTLDSLYRDLDLPAPRVQIEVPRSTTTTTTTTAAPTTTAPSCHPSYVGACVPIGVSDVDCRGGSGNGPYYVGRVTVVGPDVYDLDRDNDGVGCESS
jgi:hypothetical protein